MWLLDLLAERQIKQAYANGELSNLSLAGKRLDLQDDRLVPEQLRTAYRLLKNAGFIPEEMQWLREINNVDQLIGGALKTDVQHRLMHRREQLLMKLEARGMTQLAYKLRAHLQKKAG